MPRELHAVERNRMLVGEVFGYAPEGIAHYGLLRPDEPPSWAPAQRYVVMLARREPRGQALARGALDGARQAPSPRRTM